MWRYFQGYFTGSGRKVQCRGSGAEAVLTLSAPVNGPDPTAVVAADPSRDPECASIGIEARGCLHPRSSKRTGFCPENDGAWAWCATESTDLPRRTAMTEYDIHQDFCYSGTSKKGALASVLATMKRRLRSCSPQRIAYSLFPVLQLIGTYKRAYVSADFFAGICEGVMAVPMGMSYSMLARLPPQLGLYVNLIYPIVYMLMGTGKHISVGVSAIEDLLVGESVTRIIREKERLEDISLTRSLAFDVGTSPDAKSALLESAALNEELLHESRVGISFGMSVCVGVVLLFMRILQAGIIADLLAVPVLSGFSTASAFLIGTSQLKHLMGISVPAEVEDADFKIMRQWWYFITHIVESNWCAVGICVSTIFLMAVCKFISKRYTPRFPIPGPLIAVIFFTGITYGFRLDHKHDLKVVGSIPSGFPRPHLPSFSVSSAVISDSGEVSLTYYNVFLDMLREAIALGAMFFVIHISIAKTITQLKKTYRIVPEQELLALGCCNVIGSCFQCFPNATSLSRTSVVSSTGGETQLHQVSNIVVLVLTLSVMTPLLYHLPNAVLGAVVLFGVYGMVDFSEFVRLVKIGGLDALLWLICFLVTIVFGAVEGIIVSVLLSLLWLLRKTARPQCCVLGRLPDTFIYRNIDRFPMACEEEGIKIVRFDASLNFSNSDFFETRVLQLMTPATRILIVDGSSINDLDVTSIRMLERFSQNLAQRGVTLLFANWKGPMRDFLQRAAFYDTMPLEHCFLSLPDAVHCARQHLDHGSCKMVERSLRHFTRKSKGEPDGPGTDIECTLRSGGTASAHVAQQRAAEVLSQDQLDRGIEYPLSRNQAFQDDRNLDQTSHVVSQLPVRSRSENWSLKSSRRTCNNGNRMDTTLCNNEGARKPCGRSKSLDSVSQTGVRESGRSAADREVWLWDGLTASNAKGLHVVTEITSSGKAIQWTVVTTNCQGNHRVAISDQAEEERPIPVTEQKPPSPTHQLADKDVCLSSASV